MGTGATMTGCLRCRIRERYGEQVRSTLKESCLRARLGFLLRMDRIPLFTSIAGLEPT